MAYPTVLKINKKSFSNSENFHVGNLGIEAEFTVKEGWAFQLEPFTDVAGHAGLRVTTRKLDN